MIKIKAFTLVELLIALTVFAILATITSSSLYHAFNTRARVNVQSNRLNELELVISTVQKDINQVVERPVRGNEMRLFPLFIGQLHYLEFTRSGITNPESSEKRSTLKRIAWVCEEDKLIRRTWVSLDTVDRNAYQDKLLLADLKECHFNFLNQNLQWLPEWREHAVTQNQSKEPFPKAVQINLTLNDWGEMKLLFIIPGALYATA